MAAKAGAWGIDIGQAGLKAIRLEISDATEQVMATAFDYIAHPKILSQPDAIPEELISQALDKFLTQNETASDAIAISVPGQSALARFIQLPPVEASKVSEIVKYEARQQIPFALEDVVWDYQTLGKGTEESGFLLEAEVGLFAMKRDQVINQLKPFTNAGVEVELIQIAPLALYNFLSFDQLGFRLGDETVAMDAYTILLDMGADNTTLLVSNGQKIWIRNVPIGGNHFTRALTKEMKLTFAKAEHLKCNATKSPDPRAVFQALRPVFNDYVSEIQRSIGYFSSVNRDAKISKVVGLGNGFKLAGLQKFLQQNLQYEVERVESFGSISADGFKDAALFEENILSFPVCYGTALQALKQTRIRTSLLPKEITTARTIARKKPWAVAAAAILTVGLATSAFGYARAFQAVSKDRFEKSEKKVQQVGTEIGALSAEYGKAKAEVEVKKAEGTKLITGLEKRTDWLQLYKAIDECLPQDPKDVEQPDIRLRNRVRVLSIKPRYRFNLGMWYDTLPVRAREDQMDDMDKKTAPTGGGYIVTIEGEHLHDETAGQGMVKTGGNADAEFYGQGEGYLLKNFVRPLQQWTVPAHDKSGEVGVRTIGISHATLVECDSHVEFRDPAGRMRPAVSDPQSPGSWGGPGGGMFNKGLRNKRDDSNQELELQRARMQGERPAGLDDSYKKMTRWTFVVEVVWTPDKRPQKPATPTALVANGSPAGATVSTPGQPASTPPGPGVPGTPAKK